MERRTQKEIVIFPAMKSLVVITCFFCCAVSYAQDTTRKAKSLFDMFARGSVHGKLRTVYITDINDGTLQDYHAFVAGGNFKYETVPLYGISAGAGASFTYNLSSSDLGAIDSATGQRSRYELLHTDVENPYNTMNMKRLDALFLKYRYKDEYIVWGKQLLTTPFINQQDIHMRSSLADGVYMSTKLFKGISMDVAYIYGISPGATTRWFNISESVGVYNQGVNPNGTKGNYAGNLHSDGIILYNITAQVKGLKLIVWNQAVLSMFNTSLLQPEYTIKLHNNKTLLVAAQVIGQQVIDDGGNPDINKTYFTPGTNSLLLGGRLMYSTHAFNVSANYTRITASGRYLMPREWGREPMFTFLMREQIEGAGDLHAFTTKASYMFKKARIKADLGIGYYNMPEVTNVAMSKYGMPSFIQYCTLIKYSFPKKLKGLEAEFVYMYKQKAGSAIVPDKYIINKVNMSQISAALNFVF
jgi:hypothetical protein